MVAIKINYRQGWVTKSREIRAIHSNVRWYSFGICVECGWHVSFVLGIRVVYCGISLIFGRIWWSMVGQWVVNRLSMVVCHRYLGAMSMADAMVFGCYGSTRVDNAYMRGIWAVKTITLRHNTQCVTAGTISPSGGVTRRVSR